MPRNTIAEDSMRLPARFVLAGDNSGVGRGDCRQCSLFCEVGALVQKLSAWQEAAAGHLAALTPRERAIMFLVLDGQPNKNISADLGISQRTVENHRAAVMKKTGSRSLPELARLAFAASLDWPQDSAA
jgi:two-component system CheB/CheR fusion protein